MTSGATLNIPAPAGVAIIMSGFVVLIVALTLAKKVWPTHPEVPRKCAHVFMGLATLSLPWLFDSAAPVVLMTAISLSILMLLRFAARKNCAVGAVLHWSAERRESMGDIVFPITVLVVFVLAHRDPVLFCLPLMYLTFSDPAACYAGMRFGRKPLNDYCKGKTVEGSAAFAFTTFALSALVLLSFTGRDMASVLLISIIAGIFLSLVEALSSKGIDNLTVPLAGYLVLSVTLSLNSSQLLQLVALPALVIGIFQMRLVFKPDAVHPATPRPVTLALSGSGERSSS